MTIYERLLIDISLLSRRVCSTVVVNYFRRVSYDCGYTSTYLYSDFLERLGKNQPLVEILVESLCLERNYIVIRNIKNDLYRTEDNGIDEIQPNNFSYKSAICRMIFERLVLFKYFLSD